MDVITAWDRCAAYIRPKLRSIIIEPGKEAGEYEKMSDIEALSKLTGILALAMERKEKGIVPDGDGNLSDGL